MAANIFRPSVLAFISAPSDGRIIKEPGLPTDSCHRKLKRTNAIPTSKHYQNERCMNKSTSEAFNATKFHQSEFPEDLLCSRGNSWGRKYLMEKEKDRKYYRGKTNRSRQLYQNFTRKDTVIGHLLYWERTSYADLCRRCICV